MKTDSKQIFKVIIRILVTTALLVWVFSRIDLQQLGSTIKTARWEFLVIVWALAVIAFWIRAIKMQVILRKQQCDVNIATLFGASAVTTLYSLIMPGLLSTSVKWYIIKRHTGKGSNVLSSMVYNQITEIVVRVLLGLVAIVVTNPSAGLKLPILCAVAAAGIIIGCVLALNRRTGEKIGAGVKYILRPFPEMIRSPAEKILEQIKVFQTTKWGFHLAIGAVSLVTALFSVVIYVCAAKGAGINVPAAVLVWQSSVVYLLGRLPISVANLGVREFTLIGFLALYGVEAPAVLLMSMIIFSTHIVMAAIGAVLQLSWTLSGKDSA